MKNGDAKPVVVVVGLGLMGRGIARLFDRAGATVRAVDADADSLKAAVARLADEAASDGAAHNVVPFDDLAEATDCADLVIEVVAENLDVKHELFRQLAGVVPAHAVVASNTSSLSIGELAGAFGRPEQVVGMHFFNPPLKMRLVEVVRGPGTSDETTRFAVAMAEFVGRTPIVCRDSPNFVVNRVCRPLYYEAELLVAQGVEAARVDAVTRGALGHRMGPLELVDLIGLHTHLASSESALREFADPRYRPIPIVRNLVRAGHVGRTSKRGFYDYEVEAPRAARLRVTRTPESVESAIGIVACGPDAARLSALPGVRLAEQTAGPGPGDVVVYRCTTAGQADVDEVRELAATSAGVIVDSSDGRWLYDLPVGAGWLRLHLRHERFAEVVRDPVAGIEPPELLYRLLDTMSAFSVDVPALAGLVADRLQMSLVNEAALVVEEEITDESAVDLALRLGMNHPVGPFEHLHDVTPRDVVSGLERLYAEFGDPRYRPTPLLRRIDAGGLRSAPRADLVTADQT